MSDGIGVEKVDTKVQTTTLFGLPEARGVAMAGGEDAKPVPEAAKDEAWAASWLGLAGGAKMPPEVTTLAGELEIGRFATCWAESTCWMAFVARNVGDVGDKTDEEMDGAVDTMLESGGAETDGGGIPSDSRQGIISCQLAVKRISGVHNVEQLHNKQNSGRESAKIR